MLHGKKVWHLNDEKGWHQLTMEAIDANHAVSADPEHWSFEKPVEEKVEEAFGVKAETETDEDKAARENGVGPQPGGSA